MSLGDAVLPNRTKQITSREIPAPLHSALLSAPLHSLQTLLHALMRGKEARIRILDGSLVALQRLQGDTSFEDCLFITLAFAILSILSLSLKETSFS